MLILLGLTISCADDPNSVGNKLIPDEDKLNSIKIDSYSGNFEQSFTSFQQDSVYYGSSNRILLGKYKNITSEVLIRYTVSIPDSVEEAITNSETILKLAWIEMEPNYWIGDSTGFDFSAQRIQEHWTSIGLNEDSLALVKSNLGENIKDSLVYAQGDTVLKLYCNNDVVEDWVRTSYDDSAPDNNGMFLSPISTSGIVGFQALTNYPSDPYPNLFMIFETSGIIDTFFAVPSLDIHVTSGERDEDPPNSIQLEAAINVRGKLKFDLSTVPTNALVNSAKLELYNDASKTETGNGTKDTIAVSFYTNSEADSIITEYGKYPLTNNDDIYSGEIRQFVQRWLDGEKNEGLEVKLSNEARSASNVTLYGSDYPTVTLRPRLTIYYTIK